MAAALFSDLETGLIVYLCLLPFQGAKIKEKSIFKKGLELVCQNCMPK